MPIHVPVRLMGGDEGEALFTAELRARLSPEAVARSSAPVRAAA